MKNEFIKAYAIHLSTNCYSDRPGLHIAVNDRFRRVEKGYEPEIVKDIPCFRFLVELAKDQGMNTIVVATLDAVQYDSHPEIALPGAWTKAELKKELSHIRELGMTPIPMLNFSAAHDVWLGEYAKKVSTPEYYRLCEDLIDETCELFDHPALFQLGMEEEYELAQEKYDYQVIRGEKLLAKDMNFLFGCCQKNGAKPWIFGDGYYISYPKNFVAAISKSTLISSSHITIPHPIKDGKSDQPGVQAMLDIPDLGYNFIPMVSAWRNTSVPEIVFDIVKKYLPREKVAGFWNFPVLSCREENRFKLMYEVIHFKKLLDEYEKGRDGQ